MTSKTSLYLKAAVPAFLLTIATACSDSINAPSLPSAESEATAQGVTLDPDLLFGIWEGRLDVGSTNANHFEQSWRVEFQSVDDAEAVLSHWFVDASSTMQDSVCNLEYDYDFDGTTVTLTPKAAALSAGAVPVTAVHTGDNNMELYTAHNGVTSHICSLSRTGDPEPTVTGVDRTLPQAGETVTLTGRNLQFVDHLYLPVADGEIEVTDFSASSKQIRFTVPEADLVPGYVRCQATGAHVSTWSPAMFCSSCVFFHNFSTQGTKAPYTDTEFENTINITQSLMDQITVVSRDNLPEGHALERAASGVLSPETMLCYFGNTPTAWAVDGGLDPGTGMLRFSFGDRMQWVIAHSDGLLTAKTKCKDAAIEMDIYVESDGVAEWNTGFMSFRLDKDQSKSLSQSWFAQTALWEMNEPVSFADGWKTYTIPLSAFKVTESEQYSTVGDLMTFLLNGKKQTVVKLVNYQLDDTHPAQALGSFQFCIANMRLVPYGIPANTRDE